MTVYSRNKVGKNSTVFFQKLLKSLFEKIEKVLYKFLRLFFNYSKVQKRSRDLQIKK
jgi:hypothetical protein